MLTMEKSPEMIQTMSAMFTEPVYFSTPERLLACLVSGF